MGLWLDRARAPMGLRLAMVEVESAIPFKGKERQTGCYDKVGLVLNRARIGEQSAEQHMGLWLAMVQVKSRIPKRGRERQRGRAFGAEALVREGRCA